MTPEQAREVSQRLDVISDKVVVLIKDRQTLFQTLANLERELRKAGTCEMLSYQRERDHKMQAEFLKMADHAKAALDSVVIEGN